MKKKIEFDSGKKVFPIIIAVIGAALMLAMWITRLNMTAVVCVAYCWHRLRADSIRVCFFKRRLLSQASFVRLLWPSFQA